MVAIIRKEVEWSALFQEIEQVCYPETPLAGSTPGDVRCSGSKRGRCRRLIDSLRQLAELLEIHFVLEEMYGKWNDPVYESLSLADQIDAMWEQLEQLYEDLDGIVAQAEQLFRDEQFDKLIRVTTRRFEVFCTTLGGYEQQKQNLLKAAKHANPDRENPLN